MIESLKSIKESEAKADGRIADAEKESVALVEKAGADAKELILKAESAATQKAAATMDKACADARAEAEAIVKAGNIAAQQVAERGQGNIASATRLIVSHIIGDA